MATSPQKRPLTIDDRRLAAAVRKARASQGLTVRDLASLAEVDHAQIVRIESADPESARGASYSTAVKLARALGFSIDDVAKLKKTRTPKNKST